MLTHRAHVRLAVVGVGLISLTTLACEATGQESAKSARPTQPDSFAQFQMPDSAALMQQMQGMSGMMDMMYRQMAETMLLVTFDVLTRPESAEKLATFTRNYYEALLRKGFTEEQALQIVAATGVPSSPMSLGR